MLHSRVMGPFAETNLWRAARGVLLSEAKASSFCAALDAHWGFLQRAAQHRQGWQALRDQHSGVSLPTGLEDEDTGNFIVKELKRRHHVRSVPSARRPRKIKIMPPLSAEWLPPDGVREALSPEATQASREVNGPLLRSLSVKRIGDRFIF